MPVSFEDFSFSIYDDNGMPLSGIVPTWIVCVDVLTGLPVTPPAVSDLGGGIYSAHHFLSSEPHVAGIMDFGVTVHLGSRFQLYDCPTNADSSSVFILKDESLVPAAGFVSGGQPSWPVCIDVVSGLPLTPPIVSDLGGGLYKAPQTAVSDQHISAIADFGISVIPQFIQYDSSLSATSLSFVVTATSVTTLAVVFVRDVLFSTALEISSNFWITPPLGSNAVIVESASFVAPDTVNLTVSGDMLNGGGYGLTVRANTARADDDGVGNAQVPVSFLGNGVPPLVSLSKAVSPTKVQVVFSKDVRFVSGSNPDDALNLANYSISHLGQSLALVSVRRISSNVSELETGFQTPAMVYDIVVSNIKDISGNEII